jgi:hypothetical protein
MRWWNPGDRAAGLLGSGNPVPGGGEEAAPPESAARSHSQGVGNANPKKRGLMRGLAAALRPSKRQL